MLSFPFTFIKPNTLLPFQNEKREIFIPRGLKKRSFSPPHLNLNDIASIFSNFDMPYKLTFNCWCIIPWMVWKSSGVDQIVIYCGRKKVCCFLDLSKNKIRDNHYSRRYHFLILGTHWGRFFEGVFEGVGNVKSLICTGIKKRGRRDSNPQHPDRQSGTLTN